MWLGSYLPQRPVIVALDKVPPIQVSKYRPTAEVSRKTIWIGRDYGPKMNTCCLAK